MIYQVVNRRVLHDCGQTAHEAANNKPYRFKVGKVDWEEEKNKNDACNEDALLPPRASIRVLSEQSKHKQHIQPYK